MDAKTIGNYTYGVQHLSRQKSLHTRPEEVHVARRHVQTAVPEELARTPESSNVNDERTERDTVADVVLLPQRLGIALPDE